MKNDPEIPKVSWKNGVSHGQFKKQVKDLKGLTPNKSLANFPQIN